MSRRRFGALALGVGLVGTQASCGARGDGGGLRVAFYGDPDVARGITAALAAVESRHPRLRSSPEPGGFEGYYEKLATRFAGGAAPDIVMMDFTHIAGYAQRGALLDMTDDVPHPIDPDAGRPGVLDGSRVGDRLYGVTIGTHTQTLVINEAALDRLGIPIPGQDLSWDAYVDLCTEIGRTGGRLYGSTDCGGIDFVLDLWVRQRGGELFTPEGRLGFERDQLWEWFAFWHRLRRRGAVAPVAITANNTVQPIVSGKVAMDFRFTNITGLQEQIDGVLRMLPIPAASAGDPPGYHQYVKPTNMLSVDAASEARRDAVDLAARFLTDRGVGRRIGVSLGSPPNGAVFDELRANATGVDARILDFDSRMQRNASGRYPPTRPLGADQLLTATGALIDRLNLSVGYGQITPKEAAEDFFRRSDSYLLETS